MDPSNYSDHTKMQTTAASLDYVPDIASFHGSVEVYG